jgi:Pyridine nucleotide-disulphide oxidoreductase
MGSNQLRTPAFPISQLPGSLPCCSISEDTDPEPVVQAALIHLQLLDSALFTPDAIWRDLCAFTGTLRTLYGSQCIQTAWHELTDYHTPHDYNIVPNSVRIIRPSPNSQWVEARFTFLTQDERRRMRCEGIMRLVQDEHLAWRLWTLITTLKDVDGWADVDSLEPVISDHHNVNDIDMLDANAEPDTTAGADFRPPDHHQPEQLPTPSYDDGSITHISTVVIGAGFAGLCIAGRLQALGVPYVVLDKSDSIGSNWTDRYPSVRIHTSKEYGQFPFKRRIWGPETPYHLSPADLERGYNNYVNLYGINVQLKTKVDRAFWDGKASTWTLQCERRGQREYLECRHIVLALGGGGQIPKFPDLPGRSKFRGQILHTSQYSTASQWRGLRGAVIGSANSAHDVSNDMLNAGLSSVTMVQRNRTPVLPVETYRIITDKLYNVDTPIEIADLLSIATPNTIGRQMALKGISMMAAKDPSRFDALERVGFRVERNMDLYSCLYERFGGHYLDVGVSKMIAEGKIKIKPAPPGEKELCGFYEQGLCFRDGSRLEADVVIFATGFEGNMREQAEQIVGEEVGGMMDDWWGVDAEGEIRGGWKPVGRKSFSLSLFARFLEPAFRAR